MTSRVPLVSANDTPAGSRALLDAVHGAFGATPNMFRAVANSPAKLGEQIAVAVADRNACEYCLAAHTALGRKAGASAAEMSAAQAGESTDPATAAALCFALKLVEQRGQVSEADVSGLRAAGFDDGQIVEVLAHVALNLFTNYVNVAFAVPVDFPGVKLRSAT
jgi:AhpD family alkylhydroperoxidase